MNALTQLIILPSLGPMELLLILVIVVVILGARKLALCLDLEQRRQLKVRMLRGSNPAGSP